VDGKVERTYKTFCGPACRQKNYNGKTVHCSVCGKAVRRRPSEIKEREHICCSHDCVNVRNTLESGLTKRTGRTTSWDGRVSLATPEKYMTPDGGGRVNRRKYAFEHRVKIGKFIGRPLKHNDEPVLHLNGDLSDNRLSNCYVCRTRGEAIKIIHGTLPFPKESNMIALRDEQARQY
jgi:hypothetical protein